MAENISRTARETCAGSDAPSSAAPITVDLLCSLTVRHSQINNCQLRPHLHPELGPGETSDFVHRGEDRRLRHVTHNFNLADFRWQHEVHFAAARLLVGL